MKVGYLKRFGRWNHRVTFCLIGLLAGSFAACQPCQAQHSSAAAISSDPLSHISWVTGPQKMSLADCANIDVPEGYRLTDAHGARIILENAKNPIPDNLIGLLATTSGKWWAVLEYNPEGFIKDADAQQINPATVLKAIQAQTQSSGSAITAMNWQSQPTYDVQKHSLAWSLQLHTATMQALNDTVLLLGRRGALRITAFRPYPLADAPSLTQLVQNITFKDGERYTDYQAGDKVADVAMADLIAGGQPVKVASNSLPVSAAILTCSVAGIVILSGAALLLLRKNRRHSSRTHSAHVRTAPVQSAPVATVAQAAAAPAKVMATASAAVVNGNGSNGASNGSTNGKKHFHRGRRKKGFDYPKFYTNVMRELSHHSYGGTPLNGKAVSNGHANGHKNGHANGHTNGANGSANGNGSSNGHSNGENGKGITDTIRSEIVDLIATQKNLIQEQKCLLEQQTRLIEEKRWLIEEQTSFLKGQSVQQYPLKFE